MDFSARSEDEVISIVKKNCSTWHQYAVQRSVLMDLTGLNSTYSADKAKFDAFVEAHGVKLPPKPGPKSKAKAKTKAAEEVEIVEEVVASVEEVSASVEEPIEQEHTEQLALAAHVQPAVYVTLDRSLVQAAYKMQSDACRFRIEEMEKEVADKRQDIERLITDIEEQYDRIEECDRMIAEIARAGAAVLK